MYPPKLARRSQGQGIGGARPIDTQLAGEQTACVMVLGGLFIAGGQANRGVANQEGRKE
jgi:hypothetical protein